MNTNTYLYVALFVWLVALFIWLIVLPLVASEADSKNVGDWEIGDRPLGFRGTVYLASPLQGGLGAGLGTQFLDDRPELL